MLNNKKFGDEFESKGIKTGVFGGKWDGFRREKPKIWAHLSGTARLTSSSSSWRVA